MFLTPEVIVEVGGKIAGAIIVWISRNGKINDRRDRAIRNCCSVALIGLHAELKSYPRQDSEHFLHVFTLFLRHDVGQRTIANEFRSILEGERIRPENLRRAFNQCNFDLETVGIHFDDAIDILGKSFLRAVVQNDVLRPELETWQLIRIRNDVQRVIAAVDALNLNQISRDPAVIALIREILAADIPAPYIARIIEERRLVVYPNPESFSEIDDPC